MISSYFIGELPEWLMEQFAKLSTGNCRVGSNPTLSAILNHIFIQKAPSGCSVARLSRHVWDVEAAGSNPATPTKLNLGVLIEDSKV